MIPDDNVYAFSQTASAAYLSWASANTTWSSFEMRFNNPDDGGAGVREPLRPLPNLSPSAMALPIPQEVPSGTA